MQRLLIFSLLVFSFAASAHPRRNLTPNDRETITQVFTDIKEGSDKIYSDKSTETRNFVKSIVDYKIGLNSLFANASVIGTNSRVSVLVGPVRVAGESKLQLRVTLAYALTTRQSREVDAIGKSEKAYVYSEDMALYSIDQQLGFAIEDAGSESGDHAIYFAADDKGGRFFRGLIKLRSGDYLRTASVILDLNAEHEIKLAKVLDFVDLTKIASKRVSGNVLRYLERNLGRDAEVLMDEKGAVRSCEKAI